MESSLPPSSSMTEPVLTFILVVLTLLILWIVIVSIRVMANVITAVVILFMVVRLWEHQATIATLDMEMFIQMVKQALATFQKSDFCGL
jgi:hypothetical protein